jgi:hypothetical protein
MNITGEREHLISHHHGTNSFSSHPQTNFGFMGFMDLLCNTIYWGPAYDDPSSFPPYIHRWQQLHKSVFGQDPLEGKQLEDEGSEEQKKALAERRRRIMAEKKLS